LSPAKCTAWACRAESRNSRAELLTLNLVLSSLLSTGWMKKAGFLPSGETENNRRAKYYRLTKAGLEQLEAETKRWGRISWAIATLEGS
jgi:hypothetical protein